MSPEELEATRRQFGNIVFIESFLADRQERRRDFWAGSLIVSGAALLPFGLLTAWMALDTQNTNLETESTWIAAGANTVWLACMGLGLALRLRQAIRPSDPFLDQE